MTEENTLAAVSDALAGAVERVAPSLVTVSARRRIPATGVVWGNGLVVTSDHVIESEDEIRVRLHGAEEGQSAELIGRDPGSDLALLRVEGASAVAEVAPDDETQVGHLVLAVGLPGTSTEASLGVVSGIGTWGGGGRGRGWGRRGRGGRGGQRRRGERQSGGTYLRSDTTFFPGFSGGPLVDARGRVAGINTSRFRPGNGITIPGSTVSEVVATLNEHGRIRRAYLGIGSQVTRLPEALAAKLSGDLSGLESGLLVVGIEDGSPAEAGGLFVGDILVGFGGAPLARTEDLQEQLAADQVGAAAELTVLRGGEPATLTVTPSERP